MADQLDTANALDTFKALGDKSPAEQTRFGLVMTWITLALVLVATVVVGRMIITEDEKTQLADLHQKTELWADAFDVALTRDAERLTQLVIGFEETNKRREDDFRSRARTLMSARREILEISLIDSKSRVIFAIASPSPQGELSYAKGAVYQRPETLETVSRALANESATFSEPYAAPLEASPFVDLVIPMRLEAGRFFVVARISVLMTLSDAMKGGVASDYRANVFYRDTPIISAAIDTTRSTITYAVELRPLPSGAKLEVTSYAQQLFSKNLLFWVISALAVFLIIALIGLIRFTSRQTKIQNALRAETSLRKAMSDSHLIGIRVTDMTGRIVYVNQTFRAMLHAQNPDSYLGENVPYSYWPDNAQKARLEALNRKLVTGEIRSTSYEFTPKRADGSTFDALMSITPLVTAEGAQLGWLGTLTDITEVHEAQKHIAEAHKRFTLVVNSMQSAVSVVDPAGNDLVFSNPKYTARFGETPAVHLILHDALIKRSNGKAKAFTDVYAESLKSWFAIYEQTLTWTNGHDVRLQIATDVTQRYADQQLIHEQMLQSEKNSRLITMGEMASSLAHELNQPLTAIENYAFVVKGLMRHAGVPDEHEMVMSIDRIKAQAERAAGIISRVRAFTKRSEPKVEVVAIDTIINETWELALIQAKRYQAKLAHYVAPDVETVFCDPILIEQVLLNLIRNGMEAAFEVPHRIPEVTLTIYHDIAKNVIFEVADNGPGIPKELKSRLFDPFYSTKASGMGMGLNICRTIVELHHGRLTIEDNVHTGSIFRLMLPHKKETRDVAP